MNNKWKKWLRLCAGDPSCPAELPGPLGMLTGQDERALDAIAASWQLYAAGDDVAREAVLLAMPHLIACMQPKCRPFARELIAWAMDWDDRDRLWQWVTGGNPFPRLVTED